MDVRADQFLIARTTIACTRCSVPTDVIALVLPPGHETDESDEADDCDWIPDADKAREAPDSIESENVGVPCWMTASQTAFLFLVERVSPAVRVWLQEAAKPYVEDSGGGPPCLMNHCVNCGSAIDDQDLFSEPGDAFLPASAAEACRVSLAVVDQPIQATVDGYAYEPEFFRFMTRL